jgi:hypothetical protein
VRASTFIDHVSYFIRFNHEVYDRRGEVIESLVGGSEQASKEVHTSAEAKKAAKTKKGSCKDR